VDWFKGFSTGWEDGSSPIGMRSFPNLCQGVPKKRGEGWDLGGPYPTRLRYKGQVKGHWLRDMAVLQSGWLYQLVGGFKHFSHCIPTVFPWYSLSQTLPSLLFLCMRYTSLLLAPVAWGGPSPAIITELIPWSWRKLRHSATTMAPRHRGTVGIVQ